MRFLILLLILLLLLFLILLLFQNSLGRAHAKNSGRTIAAVLGFLILFAILVIMVSKFYLIPGMEIAQHATHAHRRKMAAQALLLMCVMLMILLVGLLVTFRISRFFFPAPTSARTRTKVVDAWAEAGKRMEEEPKDPPEDEQI